MRKLIVALVVAFAFIVSMLGAATPSTANAAPKKGIDAVAVDYKSKSYLQVDARRSPANLDTPTKHSKIVFEGKTVKGKKWKKTFAFYPNRLNTYGIARSKSAGKVKWRVIDTRNAKVFIDAGTIDARFPEQRAVKPLKKTGYYHVDGKRLMTDCQKVTKGKHKGDTYCETQRYKKVKTVKSGKTTTRWVWQAYGWEVIPKKK